MNWKPFSLSTGSGGWQLTHGTPKAQLVFISGISDASERALSALLPFAEHSFSVNTLDLRGFGLSKGENPGHFGDLNGADKIAIDIQELMERVTTHNLPVLAIGHSTGSLFLQYALSNSLHQPTAAVLTAPAPPASWEVILARLLFGVQKLRYGKRGHSPYIERQTTGRYQQAVLAQNPHEWRTSAPEALDALQDHPDINQPASVQSWLDILSTIQATSKGLQSIDIPYLLISGSHDASNNFGAGMFHLAQRMAQHGLNCHHQLLSLERHDLWMGKAGIKTGEIVRQFWKEHYLFKIKNKDTTQTIP